MCDNTGDRWDYRRVWCFLFPVGSPFPFFSFMNILLCEWIWRLVWVQSGDRDESDYVHVVWDRTKTQSVRVCLGLSLRTILFWSWLLFCLRDVKMVYLITKQEFTGSHLVLSGRVGEERVGWTARLYSIACSFHSKYHLSQWHTTQCSHTSIKETGD